MKAKTAMLQPGACYMMVYRSRVLKFKVHSYTIREKKYTVVECGSDKVLELKNPEASELESASLYDCALCKPAGKHKS